MTDLDRIIEGCKKGDVSMQSELYKRYSPRFYALCRRYAADDDMADDALVEGFMTIFQTIGKYGARGSFEGWMHTIFVRTTIHLLRKKILHNDREKDVELAGDQGYSVDIDRQIDIRTALEQAMSVLTDSQRLLVNLIAIDDHTFAMAAKELEMPESTVKWQYYQAMEVVKRRMKNRLKGTYHIHDGK